MTPPQRPDKLASALASEFITRQELFSTPIDYSGASTILGWASYVTKLIKYARHGNICLVSFFISGTSNLTTASFTVPFTCTTVGGIGSIYVVDNGVAMTAPGRSRINASTVDLFSDFASGVWTNTGTKTARGQIFFFI